MQANKDLNTKFSEDDFVYSESKKPLASIGSNSMTDTISISDSESSLGDKVTLRDKIMEVMDNNKDDDALITNIINLMERVKLEKSSDRNEIMLKEDSRRFTVYPIQYMDIWNMYKKQLACFWKVEEIDFSKDASDFETLDENEKQFLKMILAFFAASDGIVNFNLSTRFTKDVKIMEAQIAYTFQMMIENIHGEAYSLMLDNIIKDPEEQNTLFNAIETVPSVKKMADWAFKWIDSSESFAHRVIAFAIIEGVFFSGAFAAIFWFKKYKNKGDMFLKGITKSNEFIARDEGLHCDFACMLYSHLSNKLPTEEVTNIMKDAVFVSQNFMKEALPYELLGMSSTSMNNYIEYIGDRLLVALNYPKLFNKKNPFKFMETIGLPGKTNFFEMRPTEYQDAHVFNKGSQNYFVLDDDF